MIEASLHETSDPRNASDPKHPILARLGLLDAIEWVPVGSLYEVRGGPVGAPFLLPDGFAAARRALCDRFPSARSGVAAVLDEIERLSVGLGTLSRGRDAFHDPREGFSALMKLWPMLRNWRLSLGEMLQRHFGSNEAVKCALAANLAYYHDDPDALWWIFFAVAQGGYLQSGGRYIRGGSQRLSGALAGSRHGSRRRDSGWPHGNRDRSGRQRHATVGHASRPPWRRRGGSRGADHRRQRGAASLGRDAARTGSRALPRPLCAALPVDLAVLRDIRPFGSPG